MEKKTILQHILTALKKVPHYLLLLWRVKTIRTYVIALLIGILERSGVKLPFEVVSGVLDTVLGVQADPTTVAASAIGLTLGVGTAMANDKMSDLREKIQAINKKYQK